ncbi:Homeobox-leucine zipper protein HAT4 [Acorus calamus]|uniref:Homeobox-leucine zipper protein HAT4 n=1 Tax=Acorus calamus TaxID=4465 RepID=A0AAV9DZU6_ACOCL|nr:Homeobox-leucine zipper protein HAT4 [Acorus calamus]
MMVGNDDHLGLSLSLSPSGGGNHHHHHHRLPLQLDLMSPSPVETAAQPFVFPQRNNRSDLLASSADRNRFLRGIDVNRAPPPPQDLEEEAGVSSPNSTVSSVSGGGGGAKRSSAERGPFASEKIGLAGEANEAERASSSRGNSDEEEDGGEHSRKKLRLSKDQSAVLEESFKEHNTLNPKQKMALAKQLNLRPRQVEVWFQNRRARTKLKQTEVDCEFLKRCCENLTDENRRLQKEVQELRALKMSPQFYMQMTPPTTLTMCPSCEKVAVSASSTDNNNNNHHQIHHHRPIPWTPTPVRARFDATMARS